MSDRGRSRSGHNTGQCGSKRQVLTCGADIVEDRVRPDLGIEGFDDGGHFDGGGGDVWAGLPFRRGSRGWEVVDY